MSGNGLPCSFCGWQEEQRANALIPPPRLIPQLDGEVLKICEGVRGGKGNLGAALHIGAMHLKAQCRSCPGSAQFFLTDRELSPKALVFDEEPIVNKHLADDIDLSLQDISRSESKAHAGHVNLLKRADR